MTSTSAQEAGLAVPAESLRARYIGLLLERLSDTRYPSAPILDRIEAAITDRDQAEAYVGQLLGLIEQDSYPSPEMLGRIHNLVAIIESAA